MGGGRWGKEAERHPQRNKEKGAHERRAGQGDGDEKLREGNKVKQKEGLKVERQTDRSQAR